MSEAGHHCAAKFCTNRRYKDPSLSYFRFPKDEKRSRRWVLQCRREDLLQVPVERLHNNYRLCSVHFEVNVGNLARDAVPVLFQEQEGGSLQLMKEDWDDIVPESTKPRNVCRSQKDEGEVKRKKSSAERVRAHRKRKRELLERMKELNVILLPQLEQEGCSSWQSEKDQEEVKPRVKPKTTSAERVRAHRKRKRELLESRKVELKQILPQLEEEGCSSWQSKTGPSIMDVEKHRCPKCSYEFEWKFQVDRHVQRGHHATSVYATELFHAIAEPEQFSCICCDFTAYSSRDLLIHYKHKHHSNVEQSSFCHELADNFSCQHCSYKSDSRLFLAKHADLCRLKTSRLQTVDNMTNRNTDDLVTRPVPKQVSSKTINCFQCTTCSYMTDQKGHLKRHMLTHASSADIVWFECTECSYKTKFKCNLPQHMLKHASVADINWLHCAQCPYKAKYKSNLAQHMVHHATDGEINWFRCDHCSFRTKHKSHWKTHMLQHAADEDVNWVQCDKCPYRSRHKSLVMRHMLRHAKDDEIVWSQCNLCPYRAKRKSILTRHMLVHAKDEDIRWFQCTHCSYRAKRKSQLKRHMLQHGG